MLEWNLASDKEYKPYTDRGGCNRCLGAITIDKDSVTRNPAYYIIAHAAKFVRPGSERIESTISNEIPNVAFKTTSGKIVLIVLNSTPSIQTFTIAYKNKTTNMRLPAGAVATYIW